MNILNEDLGAVELTRGSKFPLTEEQQAVLDHNLGDEPLKVYAFAGAGKTSTLEAYANKNLTESLTYLAFNKSVETEAKARFPSNTLAKTGHAMAYSRVGYRYKQLSNIPIWMVAKSLRLPYYEAGLVQRSLENWLNSAEPVVGIEHVVDDHLDKLEPGYEESIVPLCRDLWSLMVNSVNGFPMSHGGYMKLYALSEPTLPGDIILLDEAQDTNPVMLGICQLQTRLGKRVIMVGDPYQQIYAWRGAIDAMKQVPGPELFLTQSFRFPQTIADRANTVLSTMFHVKQKIIGRGQVLESDFATTYIARTNSMLFRSIVPMVEEDLPFHVIGTEQFLQSCDQLLDVYRLYAGKRSEINNKQIKFFRSYQELQEYAEAVLDQELSIKCTLTVEYTDRIPDLVNRIRRLHDIKAPDTFVTTHKAKGLEWKNVTLCDDFTSFFSDDGKLKKVIPPQKQRAMDDTVIPSDEVNLVYVAATRAKSNLIPHRDLAKLIDYANRSKENPSATGESVCNPVDE